MNPVLQSLHDDPRSNPWSSWLWITVCCLALVDALWLVFTPISLTGSSVLILLRLAPCALMMFMGTWTPSSLGNRPRLLSLIVGAGTLLVAWPALRLFNHLTMSTGFPLADAWLASGDRIIGFDWLSYVTLVDQYPHLVAAMDYAYDGLTGYSILLFMILVSSRERPDESSAEFIKLFLVTAIVCSTIGMFFPALSAVVHYEPADAFKNIPPLTGAYHLDAMMALRSDRAPVLDIDDLPGLVTFPSFHTAMGIIAIYCARRERLLLALSAAINLLMIASTPVFGAHYGIDIVAGALITCIVILVHRHASASRPSRSPAERDGASGSPARGSAIAAGGHRAEHVASTPGIAPRLRMPYRAAGAVPRQSASHPEPSRGGSAMDRVSGADDPLSGER